jgi:FkbM family methyltransferase
VRNQANCIVANHFSEVFASISDPDRYNDYKLIDLVAPNALNFIDVGANVGLWSSRFIASMRRPPIGLVLEPNLECFDKLCIEYQKYYEVKVVRAAISDYTGTAPFYESQSSSLLSSLSPRNVNDNGVHAILKVPVTTLDREVAALGWKKVSMIKIDAEGEDLFCLRGARQILADKLVDFIQFECNSTWRGVTIVAAIDFLRNLDYKAFQLHPKGLRAIDVDYYGECGSANWLAFHDGSPNIEMTILR